MNKDRAYCRACMHRLNIDKMYGIKMPITGHECYVCINCFESNSHELVVLQKPEIFVVENFDKNLQQCVENFDKNHSPTLHTHGVGDHEFISWSEKLETESENKSEREKVSEKKHFSLSLFKKIFK